MAGLALRREPIRVRLRSPHSCTAARCDTPVAGVVVWLADDWSELYFQAICLGHMNWARALGGCLVFSKHALPDFGQLGAAVQQEVDRRLRPANPTIGHLFNFASTTAYTTSTGFGPFTQTYT